jgi:hypothetical protein
MACRFNGGRGSGGEVVSCLARPALGRRLRIQPQEGEKLLDHPPLEDGRDDLQLPGAAVRLELQADVERQLRGIEFRYLCFRLGSTATRRAKKEQSFDRARTMFGAGRSASAKAASTVTGYVSSTPESGRR